MDIQEYGSVVDTVKLVGFLPYLREALDKMEDLLERKTFDALDKGELTPDKALFAWQEKLVLRRVLARFDQKLRVSQAIGERTLGGSNGTNL